MMMKKFRFVQFLFSRFPLYLIAAGCLFLFGCAHDNSDRTYWNIIQHFEKNGLHVSEANPLETYQVKAQSAFAFKIGERQIGIYKYDISKPKQKEKLERVTDTGVFYVVGIKYKAIRNGSFILIDYENHPDGVKIARAFQTFE